MRSGTQIEPVERARILIVDDEFANIRLMERLLSRAGYDRLRSVRDSSQAVSAAAEFSPDLILLDVHMPAPDGIAILRDLAPWVAPPGMVPVIMLTGDVEPQTRRLSLELGARDFVSKPIDMHELLLRIHNVLETRRLQLQIQCQNEQLELAVAERSHHLENAQLELVEKLALAAEYRDDDTQQHAQRVGRTTALLAQQLGLGTDTVALLRRAAPLHDVGKIGVSDAIFLKPARLTADEYATMQQHVSVGVNILANSASDVLRCAEEIVRSHHERWDGSGYPAGLKGEEIPLSGRIVAVADVFDALTHERPYKQAWPLGVAVQEVRAGAGGHFDPAVVEAFLELNHAYLLAPIGSPVGDTQVAAPALAVSDGHAAGMPDL